MTSPKKSCGARTNHWVIATAIVALILEAMFSRVIESGVRVEKVTLAEDTPALKFIPTGAGPHPVALLAHGFASSKETLFQNDQGEVMAMIHHMAGLPDSEGKKIR